MIKVSVLLLLLSAAGNGQDPMPVLSFEWQRSTVKAAKQESTNSGPARALVPDDKYFSRKARENRTDSPTDPNEATIDGRRAAIDKAVEESRAKPPTDINGYSYLTSVRNDSGKTVSIIFWEYRFTELARPANVVRRQFLCSVKLKDGDRINLTAFSTLGPSDVIDAESLSRSNEKVFDERVQVNRIEFSDGTFRQRGNWKLEDVKAAVDRATATPWGKEICRPL
jgi:hypothetical protein